MVWIQLKLKLNEFLKDYEHLTILAIGNELRCDDGLGPLFAKKMNALIKDNDKITVVDGGVVPENFTSIIKKTKPTHLIIVDAIIMDEDTGFINIIEKEKINEFNVSCHSMPITFLLKFLEREISFKFILIGIQPKNMDFGNKISENVLLSIDKLIKVFQEIM